MADATLAELEKRADVRFVDRSLLEQALRHRSAGPPHNERLEFLGDAIIGFHVAETLYRTQPHLREGHLTRLRATLVRRDSLAELARGLELGRFLRLGAGELKSGGRDRDSTLADALEALTGAIYLDQGEVACRRWLDRLFAEATARAVAEPPRKDYKTRLQEWLQGRGAALPAYEAVDEHGPPHRRTFTVECRVSQPLLVRRASAASLQRAEQAAARLVLESLDDD